MNREYVKILSALSTACGLAVWAYSDQLQMWPEKGCVVIAGLALAVICVIKLMEV